MKRFFLCVLCVLLLSGCGILGQRAYVVVEPHQEDYQRSPDSDTITVGSYGGLKNAILNFVKDGEKEGVIRAEGYSGELDEDLSRAVYEVSQLSPLGVFAVDHITYDYSRIVSYYEIHLNTAFRRSAEEIASVSYVTDMDAAREKILEAMETYEATLILRVGNYEYLDITDLTSKIFENNPEIALELPEMSMEQYPESGTQRILEIHFSYYSYRERLLSCQEALREKLTTVAKIYGSANSDVINAQRLYRRLGRDAELREDVPEGEQLLDSAYGPLVEGAGSSYGFAQAYRSLLMRCGIETELISGQKDGLPHSWCLVKLDGQSYYVDPSFSPSGQNVDFFLMGSAELLEYGYQAYNMKELPEVVLPDYLRPMLPVAAE